MNRLCTAILTVVIASSTVAPARAGLALDSWRGHLLLGYSRVFSDSLAPGGSLRGRGGVVYPVSRRWRLGPTLTFHLLGSTDVTRGSITAGLDYSMVDAALQAHFDLPHGLLRRISIGPGVAGPRTSLSVAAGGAGFEDLAVHGAASELALDATVLVSRREAVLHGRVPVRRRRVFRPGTHWD